MDKNTVVIVAGYKKEVDEFMTANRGLASRIPTEIYFRDYTAQECVEIFKSIAEKKKYILTDECIKPLILLFENEKDTEKENFGNARTVETIFNRVIAKMINRLSSGDNHQPEDYQKILVQDIPSSLDSQP